MKSFTILVLSALVAMVSATPQQTPSATVVSLTPEASCAIKCPAEDICCKANCVHVPCPNEGMANKTTECARGCPQGNGSPADTESYGRCQLACISSYFFVGTATLPTAAPSGSASLSAASGSGSGSGSGSQTASATGSGTAATAKPSGGAANVQYQLGSSAAGIIGLVIAAFAL